MANNSKQIKEFIKALDAMKAHFNKMLAEQNKVYRAPTSETERLTEITDLRYLLKTNEWPEAVPADLISSESDEDKENQAEGIIREYLRVSFRGKKFLNYGFNEKVAEQVSDYGAVSGVHVNSLDFNEEADIILCYDVLDDVENPVEILKKLKASLRPKGKIYLRVHPWTARHGSHFYKTTNKAYVHLVFNEKELAGIGLINSPCVQKFANYHGWIEEAGLTIDRETEIKQDVESFFEFTPQIVRRIKENFKDKLNFPQSVLETQFIDFVLICESK